MEAVGGAAGIRSRSGARSQGGMELSRNLVVSMMMINLDPVRATIVSELMLGPKNVAALHMGLKDELGQEISGGRLAYHLKCLEADGVVERDGRRYGKSYSLTSFGVTAYKTMRDLTKRTERKR